MTRTRLMSRVTAGILLLIALLATSVTDASEGTQQWKSFVIHVREGAVEGPVVGGRCHGPDEAGQVRHAGCARWRASNPDAWLDGECWITVSEWNPDTLERVLRVWGHELAHCVRGHWHE